MLEKYLSEISTNPLASIGKRLSLKQLAAIPQANISEEIIAAELLKQEKEGLALVSAGSVAQGRAKESSDVMF